jgi:glycosyltransferase involved in cell wall biosynthesis
MTASIIINTYNRARSLERLLPSLEHLVDARFEVVVVNGPSTDDTEAVLARYAGRLKVERCPAANLSVSRNIGIAAAAGDIVVFIDDDALPGDVAWLRRLMGAFEGAAAGRVGAAGGAALHRDTEWTEFAGGWTSDYAEQVFTDELPPDAAASRWCRRTVGNNSAFRRSALVEIGGFDERFAYYLDEADVCLRLVRAGYEVCYLPDCPVRHYPAQSPLGKPFIRDRRLIARSDTYYCLKNGADSLPRRLVETLRRAPRKHFVRELRGLMTEGTISVAELWGLRARWLRGLVEGIGLGLFCSRATTLTAATPATFLAFGKRLQGDRLSIALLSRRLPPDPHAGGIGRYTFDLARGLHELGHRVSVITESDVPVRHEGLDFDIIGVRSAAPPSGLGQTPVLAQNVAYASAVLARAQELSAQRRFDVVHASNWGFEALGLAQRGIAPLVMMLVTPLECVIAAEGWDVTLDLDANIDLDQWTIEHATRVCAPSAGVLASYTDRAGWTGDAIHTVPLGIAPQPTPPRRSRTRRSLLFVGRLERRKGIHVLMDALPQLLERHQDWQCDIVGNTAVPAAPGVTFEALFRERHANAPWMDRVLFHGAVSDEELQTFYRSADLFVAPSLFESFGLIYLEAMQYGVPVVGCSVGGVPEVVSDGEHGLLVPPNDPAALGIALDRLMSDEGLRRRLGDRAAEAVRTDRNHTALAERMILHYRAAMAEPARPRTASESTVVDAAVAVLESGAATKGIGLAFRASTAFQHGARAEAAELIAAALGVSAHPDYYAMAVEVALADADLSGAVEFAVRGFRATRDESDACLVFAAILIVSGATEQPELEGWDAWRRTRTNVFGARLFAAALTAIRNGRDFTAILVLETCQTAATERAVVVQALYHRGSALKRRGRDGEARVCLEQAATEGSRQLLPEALQPALQFHLGELNLRESRAREAVANFEACLAQNPSHGKARTLLAEARLAAAAADAA